MQLYIFYLILSIFFNFIYSNINKLLEHYYKSYSYSLFVNLFSSIITGSYVLIAKPDYYTNESNVLYKNYMLYIPLCTSGVFNAISIISLCKTFDYNENNPAYVITIYKSEIILTTLTSLFIFDPYFNIITIIAPFITVGSIYLIYSSTYLYDQINNDIENNISDSLIITRTKSTILSLLFAFNTNVTFSIKDILIVLLVKNSINVTIILTFYYTVTFITLSLYTFYKNGTIALLYTSRYDDNRSNEVVIYIIISSITSIIYHNTLFQLFFLYDNLGYPKIILSTNIAFNILMSNFVYNSCSLYSKQTVGIVLMYGSAFILILFGDKPRDIILSNITFN